MFPESLFENHILCPPNEQVIKYLCTIYLWHDLKVVYHCFSSKKDFVDIDLAKEHSKSLRHEVTEETQRSGNDDQLFLV